MSILRIAGHKYTITVEDVVKDEVDDGELVTGWLKLEGQKFLMERLGRDFANKRVWAWACVKRWDIPQVESLLCT